MNKEAQKTEQLIQIYKEDPAKENLNALVHQVQKTIYPCIQQPGPDTKGTEI